MYFVKYKVIKTLPPSCTKKVQIIAEIIFECFTLFDIYIYISAVGVNSLY